MDDYKRINISYKNAKVKFPKHVKTLQSKIRQGNSKYRNDRFNTFEWLLQYPIWCETMNVYVCVILIAKKKNVIWRCNEAVKI